MPIYFACWMDTSRIVFTASGKWSAMSSDKWCKCNTNEFPTFGCHWGRSAVWSKSTSCGGRISMHLGEMDRMKLTIYSDKIDISWAKEQNAVLVQDRCYLHCGAMARSLPHLTRKLENTSQNKGPMHKRTGDIIDSWQWIASRALYGLRI